MKRAWDILRPWNVSNISVRPFPGFWSFNPSVHFDDGMWRVLLRCADYSCPGGVVQTTRRGGRITTRNVLLEMNPATWEVANHREVLDRDRQPRNQGVSAQGFEDARLFWTVADGLVMIATTMHYGDSGKPKMVICRFDGEMAIESANIIEGPWNDLPQKNWSPFDGADEVKLLYSIERGIVLGETNKTIVTVEAAPQRTAAQAPVRGPSANRNGAIETKLLPRSVAMPLAQHGQYELVRNVAPAPSGWTSPGLRGGSQLTEVDDGVWLGIGHEMEWIGNRRTKNYWHTLYTVDDSGKLLARSEPFKLSDFGVEFAAGLAWDCKDKVVISYGTEDHDAWLAETRLDALMSLLVPVAKDEAREPKEGAA